jgi:hypothetical protein
MVESLLEVEGHSRKISTSTLRYYGAPNSADVTGPAFLVQKDVSTKPTKREIEGHVLISEKNAVDNDFTIDYDRYRSFGAVGLVNRFSLIRRCLNNRVTHDDGSLS